MNIASVEDLHRSVTWQKTIIKRIKSFNLKDDPAQIYADIIARMLEPTMAMNEGEAYKDYIQRFEAGKSSIANWVLTYVNNHCSKMLARERSKAGSALKKAKSIVAGLDEDDDGRNNDVSEAFLPDERHANMFPQEIVEAFEAVDGECHSIVVYTEDTVEVRGHRGSGPMKMDVPVALRGMRFRRSLRTIAELMYLFDGDTGAVAEVLHVSTGWLRTMVTKLRETPSLQQFRVLPWDPNNRQNRTRAPRRVQAAK